MYAKEKDEIESAEAANILGISAITLRRHSRSGKIPAIRVLDRWRYSRRLLEAISKGFTLQETKDLYKDCPEIQLHFRGCHHK